MSELFLHLLNTGISAGWLVLAVLLLRLLLRSAPKWLFPMLWGLVGLRLLLPFSIESPLSLIPSAETVPPDIILSPEPAIQSGIPAVNEAVNPLLSTAFAPAPGASANPLQVLLPIAAWVWLAGMVLLLSYALFRYFRLKRRMASSVLLRDNIRQSEAVSSPFVLGLFRPRIYLPFSISEEAFPYILAHEEGHIARGDHFWKPLAFGLLAVYWFHPLSWVAYLFFCRDIELACDEKVIRDLRPGLRADYSQTLLACSVPGRTIALSPLSFGETHVKERIKNILRYKKPTVRILIVSLLLLAATAVCFLTNPRVYNGQILLNGILYTQEEEELREMPRGSHEIGRLLSVEPDAAGAPRDDFCGIGIRERYVGSPIFQSSSPTGELYLATSDGFLCFVPSEEFFGSGNGLSCTLDTEDGRILCQMQWYYNGDFDFDYTALFPITAFGDSKLVFSAKDDMEILSIGEDYYEDGNRVKQERYALERTEEGTFEFPLHHRNPDAVESAVYYIPYQNGKYVLRVVFATPESALNDTIRAAVTGLHTPEPPNDVIVAESHKILSRENLTPDGSKFRVCVLSLLETFSVHPDGSGDALKRISTDSIPAILDFTVVGSGGRCYLTDYQEAPAGADEETLLSFFPPQAARAAAEPQPYLKELQDENLRQAQATVHRTNSVDTEIASLVDAICAEPQPLSALPDDCIAAHQSEYNHLLSHGEDTLRYCFRSFLAGGQTDMRGQILRSLLDDLAPEAQLKLHAQTGQEYFDAWRQNAKETLRHHSPQWMQEHQRAAWLLLQMEDALR